MRWSLGITSKARSSWSPSVGMRGRQKHASYYSPRKTIVLSDNFFYLNLGPLNQTPWKSKIVRIRILTILSFGKKTNGKIQGQSIDGTESPHNWQLLLSEVTTNPWEVNTPRGRKEKWHNANIRRGKKDKYVDSGRKLCCVEKRI